MTETTKSILELDSLLVRENNTTLPYTAWYTPSGLPYYVAPDSKHEETTKEFLFLPITQDEFTNDSDNLFFGFRIMVNISAETSTQMVGFTVMSITTVEMSHDVCRVRYYPNGDKSIMIDRVYDSLYPPHQITFESHVSKVTSTLNECINTLLDMYCNHYLERSV